VQQQPVALQRVKLRYSAITYLPVLSKFRIFGCCQPTTHLYVRKILALFILLFLFHTPGSKYTESIVQYVLSVSVSIACWRRLSSDELKKSRPRHTKRIIVLRSLGLWNKARGICLAAIMTCEAEAEAEGNAEKQLVGGNQKIYHSVEKSSCSYIV
jgi:hypothetical protein